MIIICITLVLLYTLSKIYKVRDDARRFRSEGQVLLRKNIEVANKVAKVNNDTHLTLYDVATKMEYLIQNHKVLEENIIDFLNSGERSQMDLDMAMDHIAYVSSINRGQIEKAFHKVFRKTYDQYREEKRNIMFHSTDKRFSHYFSKN